MKNIVILISGRGSNMEAIILAKLQNIRIAAVISNQTHAAGLNFAQKQGIATHVIDHKSYPNRLAFDEALMQTIDTYAPDCVVLAGFMRILTPEFTTYYQNRLLNIHPSLLPAFTGLNTHQRAIDMGCKVTGCTIHLVTAELDHGPILAQGVVSISPEETAKSLAAKVLAVEHQLYPKAIQAFLCGQLWLENQRIKGELSNQPLYPEPFCIINSP
ncbi:MAG: phosphoribosylglycinamide formyltransferase [Neisseriaceae bacterium]|nr:phosphoribosylglycinamide formyltransferase [Neisseriaceae bacterium]